MGSVADKLVRGAEVPILVIRPEPQQGAEKAPRLSEQIGARVRAQGHFAAPAEVAGAAG